MRHHENVGNQFVACTLSGRASIRQGARVRRYGAASDHKSAPTAADSFSLEAEMELRQLRALVEVATHEHFGRAAAALKITQPALTQRVQALEREIGVSLLTRTSRDVRLTPMGLRLMPYAKRLIQIEDQLIGEVADTAEGRVGRIRIAYLLHGNVALQGKIVAEFRRCNPDVEVRTSANCSSTNLANLRDGEVDAAFVCLPADIPDGVAVCRLERYEQMMLALPSDHRLAHHDRVSVEALRGQPLILSPASTNPIMDFAFRQWLTHRTGEDLNVVAEEPVDQALEAVATSRTAAAFVSEWRAAAGARGVAFKALAPAPLVEFVIAHRADDPSPILKRLLGGVDQNRLQPSAQVIPHGEHL